jgi:menaquinone-dependent protoporphyrinogen oxidase
MKILTAYATTDGQTRKIARFAADHLTGLGHSTELLNLADAEGLDLARFDAVLLAGSLHVGIYQDALTAFAQGAAAVLNAMPTLFLPVSLSAAGDDAEDWKGLESQTRAFLDETGWHPGRILHVAGAFRFTEYDFFRAWAMRRIAKAKGEAVDPKADKEYTDWNRLAAVLSEWEAGLAA